MSKTDYLVQAGTKELMVESQDPDGGSNLSDLRTRRLSDALVDELVAIRKTEGKTQQDIADIVGIPRANISRIERKLYTPTLGILMKYANSLGKSLKLELTEPDDET